MRVLVTGGAGFIGSHLTDALLTRGDQVTVLDDLSNGRAARLDPRATLHQIPVTDPVAVTAVTRHARPEVIFHLAAQIDVRTSVTDPAADAAVNITGTINLLEAAQAAGARIVFASTGGALYGRNARVPSPEDLLPEPEAAYGTAKYCAECYIRLYNRARQCAASSRSFTATAARPATTSTSATSWTPCCWLATPDSQEPGISAPVPRPACST